jgi:hypothetical protein
MSNRYVPIISGLVSFAAAISLAVFVREWWTYLIGPFLLYFGWVSLKIGFTASDKEIEELTTVSPTGVSTKETLSSVPDEMLCSWNIHPDDADLVRKTDMEWLLSQGADVLNTLAEQDMAAVVAAIQYNVEALKMDEDEAADQAFRSLPIYYKDLEDRDNDPLHIGKLPFCIKDRVNQALPLIAERGKEAIDAAGSVNQLIRDLILSDRI